MYLTVCVTRWWAGVDNAYYTEKCLGVDSALLSAQTPTSRVHAVLGSALTRVHRIDYHLELYAPFDNYALRLGSC